MINMAGVGSKGSSSRLSSKVQNAMRNASVRRKSEVKTKYPVEEEEEKVEEEEEEEEDENIKTYIAEFDYEAGDQDELSISRRYSQG